MGWRFIYIHPIQLFPRIFFIMAYDNKGNGMLQMADKNYYPMLIKKKQKMKQQKRWKKLKKIQT